MKNELLNIKLSDKGTIKSTELVEIINYFRFEEKKNDLSHKNFMAKIRKEIETLKILGLDSGLNFKPAKYLDKQGKEIIKPYYDDIKFDNNYFVMNSKKDGTLIRKISG